MSERKTYTLKGMNEAMENSFFQRPVAKINLHNKKSFDKDTVFSTIILPIDKALKIFGDCEIMYPQLDKYGEFDSPCVKFGIVIED